MSNETTKTERFKVEMEHAGEGDRGERTALVMIIDGREVARRLDGGEPEDNSFGRDWSWVPDAIERAYAEGLKHGRDEPAACDALIIDAFARLQTLAHENATAKGFWDDPKPFGESIALMHSELSEALEADRHGDPASDHIPEFTGREEEFADVIIRIGDVSKRHALRLGAAVLAKMTYNASRPRKHGKAY